MCARSATLTLRVEVLSSGEVDEDRLASILGVPGFVQKWQELGVTKNRIHAVDTMRVPPSLLERLERAGERYGYHRPS